MPHTLEDEVKLTSELMPDEFYQERTEHWKMLDPFKVSNPHEKDIIHRLNSFGSLFYFATVVLRKRRLTDTLHSLLTTQIERTYLKEVIEWPRDHFKSTIVQCAALWWALPFTQEDEDWMRRLGYGDEWITWMHRAHDQNTRTLIASENIKNAAKMGFRISQQYENNEFFKHLFPEIQPNEKCKWTESSMHQRRTSDASAQGEGTYDLIGVGGALQSTHYVRMILDDLFGKKALNSETVAKATIEWFKLIVGAMDSSQINADIDNDELAVGNRWSVNDLNYWIRKNLPYYRFTTHSASGGCCDLHPQGKPIFPEEFTLNKLMRWKLRLGSRLYYCQFENNPLDEESVRWKEAYLNYFHFERSSYATKINPNTGQVEFLDNRAKIVHETKDGKTPQSFFPKELVLRCIIDPNHSGNFGRCRHAITVTGTMYRKVTNEVGQHEWQKRVYLLETWANTVGYTDLDNKICEIVQRWKLKEIWLEVVAAQKYLKHHLELLFKIKNIRCEIKPLKENKTENAKFTRIEALDTLFESGQFFCQRKDLFFLDEYVKYATRNANKSLIDVLDTLGYYNEVCDDNQPTTYEVQDFLQRANAQNPYRPQNDRRVSGVTGYN